MKSLLFRLPFCLFFFAAFAFGGENRFRDADFERPIRVTAIPRAGAGAVELGTLDFFPERDKDEAAEPFWRLAAHYSKYDLTKAPLQISDDGERSFATPGSVVSLRRENGETVLRLDVSADAEYDAPRQVNQPWPHLLLQRDFLPDEFLPLDKGPVLFSFDVKINPWENRLGADDDPNLHCAQTNAYFAIRNVNSDSPDYNEYIWFGVPLFDSRHEIVPPYIALDGDPKVLGTGKLIYTLGGAAAYEKIYSGLEKRPGVFSSSNGGRSKFSELAEENLTEKPLSNEDNPRFGRWCRGKIDLADASRGALLAAQERGLLAHTVPSDLRIVHFNFGWEVPGTFRCSMEIKNLSLAAPEKD